MVKCSNFIHETNNAERRKQYPDHWGTLKMNNKSVLILGTTGLVGSECLKLLTGTKEQFYKAETISEKPSFRNAFKKRRCLIIADWFCEWQWIGGRFL